LVCHAADGETKRVDTHFFQDNREIMFRPGYEGEEPGGYFVARLKNKFNV
jgi:hypothetical protein